MRHRLIDYNGIQRKYIADFQLLKSHSDDLEQDLASINSQNIYQPLSLDSHKSKMFYNYCPYSLLLLDNQIPNQQQLTEANGSNKIRQSNVRNSKQYLKNNKINKDHSQRLNLTSNQNGTTIIPQQSINLQSGYQLNHQQITHSNFKTIFTITTKNNLSQITDINHNILHLKLLYQNCQKIKKTLKILKNPIIIHIFSIYIFLLTFTSIIKPLTALTTAGPLTTMFYQPSCIQTGHHQFIPTFPASTTITSSGYDDTFLLNFQRVHLQSINNRVVTSVHDFKAYFLVAADIYIQVHRLADPNYYSSSSFLLHLYARSNNQFSLFRIKVGYLVVAERLQIQQDFIIPNSLGTGGNMGSPYCTGGIFMNTCNTTNTLSLILPSTNYYVRLVIYQYFFTYTNTSAVPYFATTLITLLNTTNIYFQTILENLITVTLNYIVLLINQDLFNPTPIRQLMITATARILNGSQFYFNFSHMVADYNFFFIFRGFSGNQIDFSIYQNSPINNLYNGTYFGITQAGFTTIAFYGYINNCPTYAMNLACQACPQGCQKCNTYPSFYCEQCNSNYVPSGNMSCTCLSPFIIVSGICDQFPDGCINAQKLANGTVQCLFCDIGFGLHLNFSSQCECKTGYETNFTFPCEQICGDGLLFDKECDDGNTLSNDGCSPTCTVEDGYFLDMSTSPPTLKSQLLLQYEIKQILRDQLTNSAQINLKHKNSFTLPFTVLKQNFIPLRSYLRLKVILSSNPQKETELILNDIFINSDNEISLKFDFDFTVEGFNGYLLLNYEKTKYKNDTQNLQFILKGTNKPLKFQADMQTFKALGFSLMGGSILNVVCLLVGLLSPKFIGLESILTLQLIYYSQLLISKFSEWPPGFVFLKYLKIASGYNEIFDFTEYFLLNTFEIKMNNLEIKKLFCQNFNINFITLFVCSIVLFTFSFLRNSQEKYVNIKIKQKMYTVTKTDKNWQFQQKTEIQTLKTLNKFNENSFWVGNQIVYWLLLPLVCAISSELIVQNSSFQFIIFNNLIEGLLKVRGIVIFISLFLTLSIGSNNFCNLWLSLTSLNKMMERPEDIIYKRTLFVYLLMMGSLILFFNDFLFGYLYSSVLVLLIHLVYMLLLIRINPYKQSLHVHTVCLMFNQVVYFVFLIVINLINFVQNLSSLIILALGYFITFCCAFSIILTVLRLYYELRYGPALQEQVQEERRKQKEEERLRKQRLLKRKQDELEEQAKLKISQTQKLRQKNDFLFENQVNEEKKIELLKWLQTRKWDQKAKQIYYFRHFTQKPLKWLKQNDNQKYRQRLKLIQNSEQERFQRRIQLNNDIQYKETISRLKQQLKKLKNPINKSYRLSK